jgi:inner membrane protein
LDSFTHIALGACIGDLLAGKKLGKKAMLIGAIANSLPDIDIVAGLWLNQASNLLAHRGITHSFFFVAVISPLLAWLSVKFFKKDGLTFNQWLLFWGLQMSVHLIIDSFTAYGTGWFEPFSHYRVSFNLVFVLDPLFTIGPTIAFIALLILKRTNLKRAKWATMGIALCIAYTCWSFVNKMIVDYKTQQAFTTQNIKPRQYFTTPTPINNLLWYIVAATDSGYYVGYRSILDKKDGVDFRYVYRNDSLLKLAKDKESVEKLVRFSKGYYTAELQNDSLAFSDMRFGELGAWTSPNPGFVFYFYVQQPGANDNVLQRRRMAMMDKNALKAFAKRVMGE